MKPRTPGKLRALLQGRSVLLTGHTGFKGSWLALWLKRLGASIHGFSLDPPSHPSFFELANLRGLFDHDLRGDVRNFDSVYQALTLTRPQIVFHLAAQPLVQLSYDEPDRTVETNVMGTLRVMEAVRRVGGVEAFVNVTSDKCYENREWVWGYREQDPMGGRDPYSVSKGCAELLFSAWQRSFLEPEGIRSTTVRAGNVVGGGDWGKDRLVPDCVTAFAHNNPVEIRAPASVRPWQHVLEPLSGYLAVAGALASNSQNIGSAYNFGPQAGDIWTVGDLVRRLAELWGDAQVRFSQTTKPHESRWLQLDCSQALAELGWRAIWSVPTMLDYTVSWYKAWASGAREEKLRALAEAQIEAYEGEAESLS